MPLMSDILLLSLNPSLGFQVFVDLAECAARDCFFGPPPKPEAGHPDPRPWMKQVMEEVRKNCPGKQQAKPAELPTATGEQRLAATKAHPFFIVQFPWLI